MPFYRAVSPPPEAPGRQASQGRAAVLRELQLSGASWAKIRRVVAKVEWHAGELYPRVGFILTNLHRTAERVDTFYDQRGTAEKHIKEGKNTIWWTRLSCRKFTRMLPSLVACTRLQPRKLPAHSGVA